MVQGTQKHVTNHPIDQRKHVAECLSKYLDYLSTWAIGCLNLSFSSQCQINCSCQWHCQQQLTKNILPHLCCCGNFYQEDRGSTLNLIFFVNRALFAPPCQAFERLSSPARSSVFLPRFFSSFLQKCHRSASKLARSSPLIRHKTPLALARFLCVVIGTSIVPRGWEQGDMLSLFHGVPVDSSLSVIWKGETGWPGT